ncbi:bifunctional transcriptional activator/DNA repair enzyme AdaA [Paenisporosarcina cavernae]|nr:Ada metal-binding domain-containing protein [Paenisporosarcina cavernae]
MEIRRPTDSEWDAIVQNDAKHDASFFYGVSSTHIFCKVSCKSRTPKRENVHISNDSSDFVRAGYSPCKRCKPDNLLLPEKEWVHVIEEYIAHHFQLPLTLQTIADACHGSPSHVHRTVKKHTGLAPLALVQQHRIEYAKHLLSTTEWPISRVATKVGYGTTAYFITTFKKFTSCTPLQFRKEQRSHGNDLLDKR